MLQYPTEISAEKPYHLYIISIGSLATKRKALKNKPVKINHLNQECHLQMSAVSR